MKIKHIIPFIYLLCLSLAISAQPGKGTYDVYTFGAKGDAKTMDTKAIQAAIDQCHDDGGGKVYLHSGRFLSGTIYLKSNVTLYIEAGTTLLGSDNLDDYPIIESKYPAYTGEYVTNKMLIYAEDAKNIAIIGRGTIDGRGDDWVKGPYGFPSFSVRPRIIHLRGCENIQVRDITLYNSASWVQSYQSCRNLLIDGITVDSRENDDIEALERYSKAPGRNCDGLDLVDCEFVRVSNSYINSGDDAIVLKSLSPDEGCKNITIVNCTVTCHASGIKIGTETSGAFEDIVVNNCTVYDTWGDAINVSTVDGARIERVSISNISIRNVKGTAIFVRLGSRAKTFRKNVEAKTGILKDVLIQNIQGTRISSGCSISGLATLPVENITLKNINLEFEGGGTTNDADRVIPENDKAYPSSKRFRGSGELPTYGFYVRHGKNITLDGIQLRFTKEDHRPALQAHNIQGLQINDLQAAGTALSPALIRLEAVQNAMITHSRPLGPISVFLKLAGSDFSDIALVANRLKYAKQVIVSDNETARSTISEINTIK